MQRKATDGGFRTRRRDRNSPVRFIAGTHQPVGGRPLFVLWREFAVTAAMGYPDSEVEVGVVLAESTGLGSGTLEADAMTNALESPSDDSDSEPEERCSPEQQSVAKVDAIENYDDASATASASAGAEADGATQIDEDDCPLCLDTVTDGFRTRCGHVFCAPCLAQALLRNDSCPVCRRQAMHTCASPKPECPLCVAGHKPGVVVPNVFVTSGRRQSPYAHMSSTEVRLLWFQVIALFAVLVLAGFMCVMGMLPMVAFCTMCVLVTLTNVALVSQWSRAMCIYWLQLLEPAIVARDEPAPVLDDRQDHDIEAPAPVLDSADESAM